MGQRRSRSLVATVVILLLIIGTPAFAEAKFTPFASANGFSISAQSTMPLGQSIDLTGTICPNPDNLFEFVVTVTYSGPNGQVVTENEKIAYGAVSLCDSQFVIDSLTYFNSTGGWEVTAQAQWVDTNDVQHTMDSNPFYFTIVQETTASANITTTSTTSPSSWPSVTTSSTSTTQQPTVSGGKQDSLTANGTQDLQSGYYYDVKLDLQNASVASYVIYYTVSNVSIVTAFMTQSEYASFSSGVSMPATSLLATQNSTFVSSGNYYLNFNGLLVSPGTYYFVFYSNVGSAHVLYSYDADLSLQIKNETTSYGAFILIPPRSSVPIVIHDETLGATSKISILGASNETLSYSLLGRPGSVGPEGRELGQQLSQIFTSPPVTTTNVTSQAAANGEVTPFYNFTLSPGLYAISLSNNHTTPAFAYLSYDLIPQYANPYLSYADSPAFPAAPTGIAAFGLYNDSGVITPYNVTTSEVVGFANITSILVAKSPNCSPNSQQDASLQLNSILVIEHSDGSTFSYWPQNVPSFYTTCSVVQYDNDVLNMTGDGAYLTNDTITSSNGGFTAVDNNSGIIQDYYGIQFAYPQEVYGAYYNLPFAFLTVMNETVLPGEGVLLQFGIDILQNGTTAVQSPTIYWFDNVMIHDPAVSSAYFLVSGSQYTPIGADKYNDGFHGGYYDSELVFGGGGGGASSDFQSLSAMLALQYLDPQTGNISSFPSYYSFGGDTAESTGNVHVEYGGGGLVFVSTGTPDYLYLTDPSVSSTMTTPTSPSPTVPAGSTNAFSTTSNILSTCSPCVPQPNYNGGMLLAGVIIVVIVAALSLLLLRRRRGMLPLPPPP